jgi:hypothetical protein
MWPERRLLDAAGEAPVLESCHSRKLWLHQPRICTNATGS